MEPHETLTIRPKDLKVGDVFEEPESEEEHHGQRKEVRDAFEVLELQYRGTEPAIMTFVLACRQRDQAVIEVHMVPWVWLAVKRPHAPQ